MSTAATTHDPKQIRLAADLLKQASDPTRLRVLLMLAEGERNVTAIVEGLGLSSQPAVSHHLSLLRHGGLIEPSRDGKFVVYGLTDKGRALAGAVAGVTGCGRQ